MTPETVLAVTVVWVAVGFIVFRWSSHFADEEIERQLNERDRVLKEDACRQARLAEELEAARAELRSLQTDRCASQEGPPATVRNPSRPCLEQ